MAGRIFHPEGGTDLVFRIGTPNLANRIRQATKRRRVLKMQLDGDELEAALWGFENYKKKPRDTRITNY